MKITAAQAIAACKKIVDDGKPVGVITRHDLLGFLSSDS